MNQKLLKKMKATIELNRIATGNCPICNIEIKPDDFKDELSKMEFQISKLCQLCQDKIFG